MECKKRKSVFADLNVFDYTAKENNFIQVTEWTNGEGWDSSINDDTMFSLTQGQLEAINYLSKKLDYEFKEEEI